MFRFLERGALGRQFGLLGQLFQFRLERGVFSLEFLQGHAVFKFEPLLLGGKFGELLAQLLFGNAVLEFESLFLGGKLGQLLVQLLFGDAVFQRQLLLPFLQICKGTVGVGIGEGPRRQSGAQEHDTDIRDQFLMIHSHWMTNLPNLIMANC